MIRNIQNVSTSITDLASKPTPRLPGTPMGATGISFTPEPINGNSGTVLTPAQKLMEQTMLKGRSSGF